MWSWPLKVGSVVLIIALAIFLKLWIQMVSVDLVSEGIIGVFSDKTLPQTVTNLLSLPLVSVDGSGSPQPQLAKSWTVNNNATIYTFTLKDNLYWNDGSRVISSDIVIDLDNVTTSYPDDKTLELKLAEPFSPLPSILNDPVFKKGTLIGLGNYWISSLERNQQIITKLELKARSKQLDLPDVVVRFYPDEKTLKTAFDLGEIQSMIGVSSLSDYTNQDLLLLKKIRNLNKIVAIFYNNSDKLLGDKNLRLALSYATPDIPDEEEAIGSIPSTSWAYNTSIKDIDLNEAQVKNYLSKTKLDPQAPIQLTTTPQLAGVAELVVASWKKLGIPSVVRIESGVPQNFQALLTSQPIPLDPDQYGLWHSTQARTNISQYKYEKVDLDLEEARKGLSKEARKEFYFDFQKVLVDQSPATFLYFPKLNVVYRHKIDSQINQILPLQFPIH